MYNPSLFIILLKIAKFAQHREKEVLLWSAISDKIILNINYSILDKLSYPSCHELNKE